MEEVNISEKDCSSLVLSYLVHSCYKETAECVAKSLGVDLNLEFVDTRKGKVDVTYECCASLVA